MLIQTINHWEQKLSNEKNQKTAQSLISLYNKVVEYYAATNNMDESQRYLQKLKLVFNDTEL